MATGGNNRINFQVGFNVDKAGLNEISRAFLKIQNIKPSNFQGTQKELVDIKKEALRVELALNNAFNPKLNSINFTQFKQNLGGLGIDKIYTDFNKLGATGKAAFNTMSTSILTTNTTLRQTSSFVQNIGTTLMNTVKWTVASSAIKAFTGSISQAFTYVKSLDSSLNDIRIVTKDSADLMANFAVQANRAASELGRSTLDYTKAALTFYQQGLDDLAVQARTLAVLKAQNITGAGSEMADYLTAVWNGYKVVNEEAELYVDKLAAVADSSASNMSLIAIAMSKVSSAANSLGVDVDSLTAQIATIVATTRLAPESVGNALKTIYARINDISVGADDAEVTLGNYSTQMRSVGINVLDANGRLRDTGDVIDEVGEKWSTLSREQQIFLARTMAGQRQYNKLISLFDNWSKYTDLVTVSMLAQGATELKNAIYMESLAAHTEQLGAAQLRLKSSMVDSDSYKSMIDVATSGITLFANFILSIGGGGNALLMLGSIFAQVFSGVISKEINNVIINMQNVKYNAEIIQGTITTLNSMTKDLSAVNGTSIATERLNQVKLAYASLTALQQNNYNSLIQNETVQNNQLIILELQKNALLGLKTAFKEKWYASSTEEFNLALKGIEGTLENADGSLDLFKKNINALKNEAKLDVFLLQLRIIYDLTGQSNEKILEIISSLLKAKDTGFKDVGINDLNNIVRLTSHLINLYRKLLDNISDEKIYNVTQALEQQRKVASSAAADTKRAAENINRGFETQGIIKGIAGIGQLASGIRSLSNITKIWLNQSLSTGEKILQTFTSLSMGLTMLVNGASKIGPMFTAIKAVFDKYTLSLIRTQVLEAQEAIASGSVAAAKAIETGAVYSATNAWIAHIAALAPYLLLIGGITAAIIYFIKLQDAASEAIQKASEAVKEADDAYQDLKNTINDFNSSVSQYELMQKSLLLMDKNTEAWNEKLKQSNQLVLELVLKFPLLANIVENVNGVLRLNDEGLKQLSLELQRTLDLASLTKVNTRINRDELVGQSQTENLTSEVNRRLSANTTTYQANVDPRSIQELATAIYNFQNGSVGTEYTDLKSFLQGEFATLRYSEISYIVSLIDDELAKDFSELGKTLNENQKSNELAYLQAIRNNSQITESDFYKKATQENQNALIEILTSGLVQSELDKIKLWKDKLDLPWQTDEANESQWGSDVLNQLNQITGKNYRWTDNSIQGSGADRVFLVILEGATEAVTYSRDYIASMMAAKLSLDELGTSSRAAEKGLKELSLDKYQVNNAAKGIQSLILGNGLSNLSRLDLDSTVEDNSIILSWAKGNELIIQKLGYDSAKDFAEAYSEEAKAELLNFDSFLSKRSDSVQNAFTNLNLEGVSLDLSKQIVNTLQTAFNKNGKEGLAGVEDFYNSIIDFDELEAISKNIDFNNISVEDFKETLLEAGIATDISTEALEAYINAQKNNSTTTLDELRTTYGTIHGIIDKLKDNGSLSPDDAAKLQAAGINLEEYFQHNLDGTWKLKTSAELFYNYANSQSLEGFKAKLEELKLSSILGQAWNRNKYSAESGSTFDQFSSSAGSINYETETTSVDQEKIASQIQFLKYLGEESQIRAEIEAEGLATYEQAQKLALLVAKHKLEWEQSAENVQKVTEEVENLLSLISLASKILFVPDADVNKLRWQNLFEYFNTKDVLGYAYIFQQDELAAKELADELLRFDSALEKVKSNYLDWKVALASGNEAQIGLILPNLSNAYSDLFDWDPSVLTDGFLQNGQALLYFNTVLNGTDEEAIAAYESLEDLAMQEIAIKAGVDLLQFNSDYAFILAEINKQLPDLEVGAELKTEGFILALNQLLASTARTKEEALAIVKSLGVEAEVLQTEPRRIPTTMRVPQYDLVYGDPRNPDVVLGGNVLTEVVEKEPKEITVYSEVSGFKISGNVTKGVGGYNKIHSSPTRSNTQANKKGGGGSKKSPKKKSKKKGSKKKKKEEKTVDKDLGFEDKLLTYDPYEKVTKLLERQSDQLEKLQKQEDKLTGKDRLANLQKQNKTLQKQNQLLRQRQAISDDANKKNTTAWFKKQLKTTTSFKNIVKFDSDGQISDIAALLRNAEQTYNNTVKNADKNYEAVEKKYNNYIKKYNKMSAKKQESSKVQKELLKWKEALKEAEETAKNAQKAAEDKYKLDTELIKSYTEALEKDNEARQNWLDNLDKITEIKFAKVKIGVDLSLEMGLLERDWLDFEDKFIKRLGKDDFLGQAQSSSKKLFSFFDTNLLEDQVKMVKDLKSDIAILNKGLKTTESSNKIKDLLGISAADWAKMTAELKLAARQAALAMKKEDLLNYLKTLQNSLTTMQEQADAIRDSVLSGLDKAKSDMDDQISQFERVNSLIEHGAKLSEMLFGEKAYDNAVKFYNMQKENNIKLMQRIALDRAYWENIYQQQRLADDDKRDELLMQKALSNLQAFDDQLRSTLEETIDILHNEWESKVQGTLQKMNNTLTSGYGLDFANEEWDYITKFDDYFLDNVESKMGIEEIERLFDNASKAAAGDANAQARLSKIYQEQMKTLRNKEKLTQYDIDRAKKMLEIEQARLAIEKAREQKTTMRLRRDSQGNYTYRYVADEDEITDLADKLANLEYNLYEDDKNQYKKNLNQMLSFYEDYQKKMMELEWEMQQAKAKGDELLIERMQRRIDALREYGLAMGDNLAANQDYVTSTYWTQSTADSLGIENYTRLLMLKTMADNIPIVGVALQLLDKSIRSAGGFLEALAPFEKEITTAGQEYAAALTSAMEAAQTSTATMTTDIDKAVDQTTKIVDNYDTIINKTKEEVDEVGRMLQNVNEAMEKLRSGTELMRELYDSYSSIQNLNLLNAVDNKNGTDLVSRVGLTSTTLNEKMENLWTEWKEFYKSLLGADEMATGGYTGAWGDDGKVAVLHEKELVLNAEDTSNLLAAVGAVRDITSRMSIAGALDSLAASQTGLLNTLYNQHSQLDQNVHIEANFPNVTQHTEIEQAFENLVNIASMHASKRVD